MIDWSITQLDKFSQESVSLCYELMASVNHSDTVHKKQMSSLFFESLET